MTRFFRPIPILCLLFHLAGCPTGDDDDSADDDDDATTDDTGDDDSGDDDSGDDDSGDDDSGDDDPSPCAWALASVCADEVVDAVPSDSPNGDPWRAVNGVRGGGQTAGGTDVFSLDYFAGSSLTLRWSGRRVLDGPGVDLVVYENAFEYGSQGTVFMDLAIVEVSIDGLDWIALPHDYVAADETAWSAEPDDWQGFAGRTPILLHEEDNRVDPVDPSVAGGDGFDLAELPDDGGLGEAVKADGFVFLRLVAAPSRDNPDTGAPYVFDAISNGADIDGVYAALLAQE